MVYHSEKSTCRSHPRHHDHGERDLEAETNDPEKTRLMIHVFVFLEIFRRAAGQSLPENPNRSTHSWESKRAPNYRRFL